MHDIDFEWDPTKERTNLRKHRVSFAQAATIFLDAMILTLHDVGHSLEEERWVSLGRSADGGLLVVVHTFEEPVGGHRSRIRIISARRATARERKQLEEER